MSVITGRGGDVKGLGSDGVRLLVLAQIRECTKWTFSAEINVVEYASNLTGGYKVRLQGSSTAKCSLEGVYDNANPITEQIQEGDRLLLQLIFSPLHYIQVHVVCENLEIEDGIEDGEIVTWKADFSATPIVVPDPLGLAPWTYPAAIAGLVAMAMRGESIKEAIRANATFGGSAAQQAQVEAVVKLVAEQAKRDPNVKTHEEAQAVVATLAPAKVEAVKAEAKK